MNILNSDIICSEWEVVVEEGKDQIHGDGRRTDWVVSTRCDI